MLNKLKKSNDKGFTIIEVMIVLAIGGLILLIVFLAVPALQRNGRNTQRKSDVASVLGAASEYVSNNGGALPVANGTFNAAFTGSNPKLGFYTTANVTYNYSAVARGAVPAAPTGNDTVTVYNYLKCGATPRSAPVTAGASTRSVVAYYNIESNGVDVPQCIES